VRIHRKEDCEDLRKAVERGDVHVRDRWIYLGQQEVGDTVLVPTPQEIEGKMKWQKDWVHERLLAKESEMPKVQYVTGDNTTKTMVYDILEQMNGEEVVYKLFWDMDIEEKRARDMEDEGDHPDTKCPAFSPPTKILKRDKPLRQLAGEHEEKHEKRPQPEKMWNTLRDSVDIGELRRRTLDAPVPGVRVRELLSISLDIIRQWFGVKRVPPLKKEPDALAYAVKWKEAMKKLYACASPKCKGRIEDIEFEMLIDSSAELCLMSREVFEELGIPVDFSID